MLSSKVAMTDAKKESEARCKEMLNQLIAVVKKQTLEIEDLAESMRELAIGLRAVVQTPGATAHALPSPVTTPTATLAAAVDHAVAAATPRADAALAPEAPTRCSINCSGDKTVSQTSAFRPNTAPGSSSTTALLEVTITSPEPTVATIWVRGGTSDLAGHQRLKETPLTPLVTVVLDIDSEGFCTPGMCMSIFSSFVNADKSKKPEPPNGFSKLTVSEAERAFSGNLCRCTGYRPIVDACKSFASDVDLEDLGLNIFWKKGDKQPDVSKLPSYTFGGGICTFPDFLKSEIKSSLVYLNDANVTISREGWYHPESIKQDYDLINSGIFSECSVKVVVANMNADILQLPWDPGDANLSNMESRCFVIVKSRAKGRKTPLLILLRTPNIQFIMMVAELVKQCSNINNMDSDGDGDPLPCEVTVNFRGKYEIHRVYVQSTARIYEIYYTTDPKDTSKDHIYTVCCGLTAKEPLPSGEESMAHWSSNAPTSEKHEHETKSVTSSSDEDSWVEIKIPESPVENNTSESQERNAVGTYQKNTLAHYGATAEIIDASPCVSLTVRLLSLQSKTSFHIEEIYIFADPVESTNEDSVAGPGNMGGSSLLSMLVPGLMQMSKSRNWKIDDRHFSDGSRTQLPEGCAMKESSPCEKIAQEAEAGDRDDGHTKSDDTEFLVIACDGIWDVLASQDLVDFVGLHMRSGVNLGFICDALLDRCITIDELSEACREFGLDDVRREDMFEDVDQNNDGQIDYSEFAAIMRKGNVNAAEAWW